MKDNKVIFLIGVVLLLLTPLVHADNSSIAQENNKSDSSEKDQWQFTLTPYLWLPSVDARATVEGKTQKVKLTFSDIIDDFDLFGVMGRFEAWKGNWGLIFDGLYADLDGDFRNSNPLIPSDPLLNELNVEIRQAIVDFAVSYRLFELPLRREHHFPILTIEPILGGRYTYLKQELTPINKKHSDSETWWKQRLDGTVYRQQYPFTDY